MATTPHHSTLLLANLTPTQHPNLLHCSVPQPPKNNHTNTHTYTHIILPEHTSLKTQTKRSSSTATHLSELNMEHYNAILNLLAPPANTLLPPKLALNVYKKLHTHINNTYTHAIQTHLSLRHPTMHWLFAMKYRSDKHLPEHIFLHPSTELQHKAQLRTQALNEHHNDLPFTLAHHLNQAPLNFPHIPNFQHTMQFAADNMPLIAALHAHNQTDKTTTTHYTMNIMHLLQQSRGIADTRIHQETALGSLTKNSKHGQHAMASRFCRTSCQYGQPASNTTRLPDYSYKNYTTTAKPQTQCVNTYNHTLGCAHTHNTAESLPRHSITKVKNRSHTSQCSEQQHKIETRTCTNTNNIKAPQLTHCSQYTQTTTAPCSTNNIEHTNQEAESSYNKAQTT